jgi:hypothetical protein
MKTKERVKFDEYRMHIADIVRISPDDLVYLKEVPWLEKREKGTKSNVYEIMIKPASLRSLILKEYHTSPFDMSNKQNVSLEEFVTEKSILKTAKKYPEMSEIFPTILSENSEYFNNKKALLVETVSLKTIKQILSCHESDSYENLEIKKQAVLNFLNTCAKFFNIMPLHKNEIEDEMKESSNNQVKNLAQMSPMYYSAHFKFYTNMLFSKNDADANKRFSELVNDYFDFNSIILHDCYTTNTTPKKFIDVGNVKIGPKAVHLGCLLGDPEIYKIFSKNEIGVLISNLSEKLSEKDDAEKLKKGNLLADIYGNLRLAAGIKLENKAENIGDLISAAKEQSKDFGEEAFPIYRLIDSNSK